MMDTTRDKTSSELKSTEKTAEQADKNEARLLKKKGHCG